MHGLVDIRGKKIVIRPGLNHTTRARVEHEIDWVVSIYHSSFEVKDVVRGYYQYKVVWDATTPCSAYLFPIIAFSSLECTFSTTL